MCVRAVTGKKVSTVTFVPVESMYDYLYGSGLGSPCVWVYTHTVRHPHAPTSGSCSKKGPVSLDYRTTTPFLCRNFALSVYFGFVCVRGSDCPLFHRHPLSVRQKVEVETVADESGRDRRSLVVEGPHPLVTRSGDLVSPTVVLPRLHSSVCEEDRCEGWTSCSVGVFSVSRHLCLYRHMS